MSEEIDNFKKRVRAEMERMGINVEHLSDDDFSELIQASTRGNSTRGIGFITAYINAVWNITKEDIESEVE